MIVGVGGLSKSQDDGIKLEGPDGLGANWFSTLSNNANESWPFSSASSVAVKPLEFLWSEIYLNI